MYINNGLSIYVLYVRSSSYGGVYLNLFWRPINAIFLLKSPHNICMWFGCESICILMVCYMILVLYLQCVRAYYIDVV